MPPPNPTEASANRAALAAIGVFLALWLPAAWLSRGFFAADGCAHYLFARFAFANLWNFTDVWARPLCTGLYALPAVIGGRFGATAASAAIAIGCAVVAFRISRLQGDRLPVLALICTLGQPMLFLHSLTVMTELPFALVLGLAFLAFQEKRYGWGAVFAALLPLARPEGMGFVILAAAALVAVGRLRFVPLLAIPLLLWDVAGWALGPRTGHWWSWLVVHFPYSAMSMYGRGNVLTFVALLPAVVSPLLLPATLLGGWQSFAQVEQRRMQIFRAATCAIPLLILSVHTLLYASGRLGSFGEARYLLIAAPFWGVLSGRGWEWFFARMRWSHPLCWAAAAVLTPLLLNVIDPVVPFRPSPDWQVAERLATWYQNTSAHERYPRLICSHPGLLYDLDISPSDGRRCLDFDRPTLLAVPPKTLLIWDPLYGPRNASSNRAFSPEQIARAGWIEDVDAEAVAAGPGEPWRIYHSPVNGAASSTDRSSPTHQP
jgi:hypothetical protein